jgi:hypothetical protein
MQKWVVTQFEFQSVYAPTMKRIILALCVTCFSSALRVSHADEGPVKFETLDMKLPPTVARVIWSIQNGCVLLDIAFPSVRDRRPPAKPDDSPHPKTKIWLLNKNGTSTAPDQEEPLYFGVSNAMRVTYSDHYRFQGTAKEDAVAVVLSVDGEFFAGRIPTEEK